jgi:DNA repair/transcription protein MET18/MMS19
LVAEKGKEEVLVRYRREVVRRLVFALDDGKREVRAGAVRCRAKWLEADEPDDE